ncbi:MAG: hypothetical protein PHD32_11085 [Eubacteriales bacterium]|nr:hypothetical protein [Eubacteriales bacterium]
MRLSEKYECRAMEDQTATIIAGWLSHELYRGFGMMRADNCRKVLGGGSCWAVFTPEEELAGFVCLGSAAREGHGPYAPGYTDVAFGMAPGRCRQHKGVGFAQAMVAFAKEQRPELPLRVTVETSNVRAADVCRKQGFVKVGDYVCLAGDKFCAYQVSTLAFGQSR